MALADFDGVTRAEALRQLLALADAPMRPWWARLIAWWRTWRM